MATSFDRNLKNIFKFDNLEKPVQQHLKNVYSCLAISMLAAAAGGYVHLFTNLMQAGLLTIIGSIGLLILLSMTPHNPANQKKRLLYLTGFAFLSGIGLGPLMEIVIHIDASIIPTALLATSVIFICFTLSALLAGNSRQFLFLGGMLFSGLSMMLLLGLVNIFIGSKLLYEVNLYLGLVIMCAFILYDTQLIVEKRRHGDDDYIWHSVDLFIDFIQVFRRIMILLANKENNRKNRRD